MKKIKWICMISFALAGPEISGLSSPEFSFGNSFLWGGVFGIIGWAVGSIIAYIVYLVKPGV